MQVRSEPADTDGQRLRLLLRAILAEGALEGVVEGVVGGAPGGTRAWPEDRGPDSWTLMAGRLGDLDALSTFEWTALPLLVGRWQAEGRDLNALPVVRGLHRRMVVRNRMVLHGAREALERLDAAGIDAMPLKSAALVGRVLPERGLRPIADVDLWVRPSAHAAAVRLLARTGAGLRDLHARMVRDTAGRELDLHRLPSHLYANRGWSRTDAERRFDRTWDRRVDGRAPLADMLHHSLVNVLFSHAPGEDRAAFALIELDTALRHPDVTDATLDALIALAVQDRTATILVEHLDRLGPGVSAPLDRLLHDHLEPALTPDDRALRTWMAGQSRHHDTTTTFPTWLRQAVHTHQRVPQHTSTIAGWMFRTEAQDLRRTPWAPLTRLLRPRTWQRMGRLAWGLLRARSAG